MTRPIVAAAIIAALASAAMAAPAHAPPPYTPPQLFLSPSGEPFRATAQAPDPLETWFDQADTGHLGYLDRAEFRADAARFFKRLDTDGDGVVDGFEVADYEHKIVPELAAWTEGIPLSNARHGHLHAAAGAQIAQLIHDPEPVMAADYDFDSRITLAEWMQATDERFDTLDQAKTGRLTLDELRARLARENKPVRARHPPKRPPPKAAPGSAPRQAGPWAWT